MEMQLITQAEQKTQKIKLVKGSFTKSEASHIIGALIDQKIKFHKTQRLQMWEGDHDCNTGQLDGRINELKEQKNIAKEFILSQDAANVCFTINGSLEITVEEN